MLTAISTVLSLAGISAGFAGLVILSLPWSFALLLFLGWSMAHDGTIFGAGAILLVVGALFNATILYKLAYGVQYNATIGKE